MLNNHIIVYEYYDSNNNNKLYRGYSNLLSPNVGEFITKP